MTAEPSTDRRRAWRLSWAAALGWGAWVAYGALLLSLIGAVAGGADASGYFNEARLLARGTLHVPIRALAHYPAAEAPPFLYDPLGMKPAPDGSASLVPTYPPGLSLMLAAAAPVAGWGNTGNAVLFVHALAGLLLVYALGRTLGLPRLWAFLTAGVLAASPLYLFMSLWAMSDVPALVWAALSVIAAWKSRERAGWALVAGFASGVAFLIRPSDFLIAGPMVIAIGLSPKRLALTAAGGLPALIAWASINRAAYGSAFESGYGDLWVEFHANLTGPTLAFYGRQLPLLFGPLTAAAVGVVGFFAVRTRATAVLAAWIVLYFGFYAPYRWTHEEWWFLRFLLPAVPALLVSAALVLQWLFARAAALSRAAAIVAFAGLFAFSVGIELSQIRPLHAWSIGRGEEKYGEVARWLRAHAPDSSVVLCDQFSGGGFFYTPYVLMRISELTPEAERRVQAAARQEHRPVYAVTYPFELKEFGRLPGAWTHVASIQEIAIWRGDWDGAGR